jgi:hypothetical protein
MCRVCPGSASSERVAGSHCPENSASNSDSCWSQRGYGSVAGASIWRRSSINFRGPNFRTAGDAGSWVSPEGGMRCSNYCSSQGNRICPRIKLGCKQYFLYAGIPYFDSSSLVSLLVVGGWAVGSALHRTRSRSVSSADAPVGAPIETHGRLYLLRCYQESAKNSTSVNDIATWRSCLFTTRSQRQPEPGVDAGGQQHPRRESSANLASAATIFDSGSFGYLSVTEN